MARHPGAYRGEKRRKELLRQKKQEEKRLKRFKKEPGSGEEPEATVTVTEQQEGTGATDAGSASKENVS